jgi:hypothetical protein
MKLQPSMIQSLAAVGRRIAPAVALDPQLGPLAPLPGTWKSAGLGWNMIALPFAAPAGAPFRLLLNQFDETLVFTLVDKAVPNRGISDDKPPLEMDQLTVTLDYEQVVHQISATDLPVSGKAGSPNLAIHHEPGLWLFMTNHTDGDIDVGRLASVPHGNSVLALGTSDVIEKPDPTKLIPQISGLPINIPNSDIDDPANLYLAPYRAFHSQPFKGTVAAPGFPGFDPVDPSALLRLAVSNLKIARTTVLNVDTTVQSAGITNIPFIKRQADAQRMVSTFWIHELEDLDAAGNPRMVLQYLQDVSLDFLPSPKGGLIRWPHISINTLQKVTP